MAIDITILICTWNRAESLRQCLESLVHLVIPPELAWEVLVVNNHCTDHTSAVIKSFSRRIPVREVCESRLGHSNARNTGIHESSGELILFTDDDVVVHEKWLLEIYKSSINQPEARVFGGPIWPIFEKNCEQKGQELTSSFFDGLLVRKNLGEHPKILSRTETLFGANMAFRKTFFTKLKFESHMGLKGASPIRGDETLLLERAKKSNELIFWVPAAPVFHRIPRERLSYLFCWNYFWGVGRTHIRLQWALNHTYKIIYFPNAGLLTCFSLIARCSFILGQFYESFLLIQYLGSGLKERADHK